MEDPGSIWQIGIIALLAGAMIGALVYRLLSPSVKQSDHIKSELDAAREELSAYKASVNQHFDKTSELVNDLTQNYVKVYQHLAEGAQNLGHNKAFNNLLEQRPGRVSIALNESAKPAETIVEDRIIDATKTSAATVDEHAEPFTGQPVDTADPSTPGDDSTDVDAENGLQEAATADGEIDGTAETKESDGESPATADEIAVEDKKKTETSATA